MKLYEDMTEQERREHADGWHGVHWEEDEKEELLPRLHTEDHIEAGDILDHYHQRVEN